MKTHFVILISLVLFLSTALASADTLTAVCKNAKGRMIGKEGPAQGNKPVDGEDGMRGGQLTVLWNTDRQDAQVVTQGSGGGDPLAEKATTVHLTAESVSFLVTYAQALWVYTLFIPAKTVLITQHVSGLFMNTGGAIAKSMYAGCAINFQ